MHTQMYKLVWVRKPNTVTSPVVQQPSSISPTATDIKSENITTKRTNGLPLWQRILFFTGSILGILSVPANVIIPLLITGSQIPAPIPLAETYDVPTGTVIMYAGNTSTLPGTSGQWLYCDASAVSRKTNADLFAIIGISFGPGDGSTTFNLPDFRNRFPSGAAGSGTSTMTTGGSSTISLTTGQLLSHSHGVGTLTMSTTGAHSHTLTDPEHSHSYLTSPSAPLVSQSSGSGTGFAYAGSTSYVAAYLNFIVNAASTGITMASTGAHTHTITSSTDTTRNGDPINIPRPYQTVSFIIRT